MPRRPAAAGWGENRRGFRRSMGARPTNEALSPDWIALRTWEDDGGECPPAKAAGAGGGNIGRSGGGADGRRPFRPARHDAATGAPRAVEQKPAPVPATPVDDGRSAASVDATWTREELRARSSRRSARRAALRRAKLAERWTVFTLAGMVVVAMAPFVLLVAILLACVAVFRRVAALVRKRDRSDARATDGLRRGMPPVGFEPTLEGF